MSAIDNGLQRRDIRGYIDEGTYVVPSYDESGRKLDNGEVVGDARIVNRLTNAAIDHGSRHGDPFGTVYNKDNQPVGNVFTKPATKDKKSKASKKGIKTAAVVTPVASPVVNKAQSPSSATVVVGMPQKAYKPEFNHQGKDFDFGIDIVFRNQFGKIKLTVAALLEEDNALCLVFKDEKELRFTPAVGEELFLLTGSREVKVFYPGMLFTWPDKEKKIMVLYKIQDGR